VVNGIEGYPVWGYDRVVCGFEISSPKRLKCNFFGLCRHIKDYPFHRALPPSPINSGQQIKAERELGHMISEECVG